MTKITHKGLWFEYSWLNKEDKSIFNKMIITALICGFFIGIAANKSDLELWSEVIHPWAFYAIPLLTLIFLLLTIKYSFDLYARQDELFRKYHDFSMMSGFMGFAVFGIILHFTSLYVEFEVQWIDYMLCSIAGMVIGQLYFYKKFYQ